MLEHARKRDHSPGCVPCKQVAEDHGVTHMAAICAICKIPVFAKVMPEYGFEMRIAIVSVHQLVS